MELQRWGLGTCQDLETSGKGVSVYDANFALQPAKKQQFLPFLVRHGRRHHVQDQARRQAGRGLSPARQEEGQGQGDQVS